MKKVYALLAITLVPLLSFAQFTLQGSVSDESNGMLLPGASVELNALTVGGQNYQTLTNSDGRYVFSGLPQGNYELKISFLGFNSRRQKIYLDKDQQLDFALSTATVLTEKVIVSATRASANSATAFQNINKEYINKQNLGQDLPYLLSLTPSVTITSDAGNGVGYTDIRIRGTDKTRINFTINGIPYNDPESQGAFLVNLPDFASSIDNLQIQRGVGTSTNGASAFGGSINIQTTKIQPDAYAKVDNSYGSFNTLKNTVSVGSGLINKNFSFNGRLSRISSDGFIDRASALLKSFFLSGSYLSNKDLVTVNVFSGTEKTYQAWNGIPEARLNGNIEGMQDFISRNYLDEEDAQHLLNSSSRTYNQFTYEDQTDNYQQDHYQLLYSRQLKNALNANIALHYTHGNGFYEEFKKQQDLADYGLENLVIGSETISQSDLVRRRWLDNDFYGLTYSLNYSPDKNRNFTLGGAYNEYKGNHFGEITWAQYASNSFINQRYYDNDAFKTDFNIFAKAAYALNESLTAFADMQYRRVYYSFLGFDRNQASVQQNTSLDFFNPKIGLTYSINPDNNIYASFGVANKEPNRDDYTESSPDSRPNSERLYDLETGWRHKGKSAHYGVNFYWMSYKDQLVLTGKINDVGAYTRLNVPESYRAGLEVYGSITLTNKVSWAANTTFSQNKIKSFTEYIDDYDTGEQVVNTFSDTPIAFSPQLIAASELAYQPIPNFSIALLSKFAGKQYLDNTGNESRKLDAYFKNDIRLSYNTKFKGVKNISFTLLVNNIFDEKYESNGYTYGYISGGENIRENFYFPQAGTNFMAGLSLTF